MATSILFTVRITARPQNLGDGNNERYEAQALAINGTPLENYRGEGPTVSSALRQLAQKVEIQERSSSHEPRGELKR